MDLHFWTPPPSHPLRSFVLGFFSVRARASLAAETILPKGNVDILFNFGAPIRATLAASAAAPIDWERTLVAGLQTRPIVARMDLEVHTFGVSLKPEAAFVVLGTTLDDLTDAYLDGSLLFRDVDTVLNRLGEAETFSERCAILGGWIMSRTGGRDRSATVSRAAWLLRHGSHDVAHAARHVGCSSRHLQRLFRERVGIAPAEYVRLMRFADALPLIGRRRSLTEVSADARYYDQAHFCRDFQRFAGMTPKEYRNAAPMVPGHIFSPVLMSD